MTLQSLKKLIGQMMTPNTKNRPDIVDVMTATSVWDRVDRTTVPSRATSGCSLRCVG